MSHGGVQARRRPTFGRSTLVARPRIEPGARGGAPPPGLPATPARRERGCSSSDRRVRRSRRGSPGCRRRLVRAASPFAFEARAGHPDPETGLRPRLEALDPRFVAEQAKAGLSRTCGRGRGPCRQAGPRRNSGKSAVSRSDREVSPRPSSVEPSRTRGVRPRRASPNQDCLPYRPWLAPPLAFTATSAADRVPHRLHLEEGGNPFRPFRRGVVEPIEPRFATRVERRERRLMSSAASSSICVRIRPARPTCRARRRRRGRQGPGRLPRDGRSGR